jgi:hypothetical protein
VTAQNERRRATIASACAFVVDGNSRANSSPPRRNPASTRSGPSPGCRRQLAQDLVAGAVAEAIVDALNRSMSR